MFTPPYLQGVHCIIITPFTTDGEVDLVSLERLVEGMVARGVHGVTALGIAAEAHKLSADERVRVGKRVLDVVDGRCGVIVGVSASSAAEVIESSQWALGNGATGVMVAPPHGLQYGQTLIEHYTGIGKAIDLPIVLQDYAEVTGVELSPEQMAALVAAAPAIRAIKLESVPTAARIAATRKLLDESVSIVGGIGGVYFFDELKNGADGTMTGFAYPEILLKIWDEFERGNSAIAAEVYNQYRSLLEFEGQPKIGLAIRKEILRRRGLISDATVRAQPPLSEDILERLTTVIEHTGAKSSFDRLN